MIHGFRVKNLRSIGNSGKLKTKPLTILVGKNSCGKSTFARAFPLLRQSVEEKTRTPILWFGRYVDFGDFQDAIKTGEDEITFSFDIEVNANRDITQDDRLLLFLEDTLHWIDSGTIECSLTVAQGEILQYTKRIEVKLFGNHISIEANGDKEITSLKINNEIFPIEQTKEKQHYLTDGALIPKPRFWKVSRRRSITLSSREHFFGHESIWHQLLFDELYSIAHQNTQDKTINGIISRAGIGYDESIKKLLSSNEDGGKHFKNNISDLTISSEKFQKIKNCILATRITSIFEFADNQIDSYFRGIKYIEPLRATAERYYRVQDLAVDEIDPRGSNIAMYVKSLSPTELNSFNVWCQDALNFKIGYDQNPGHMAIKICEENNKRNITDMGFGYSQLLPIAMHIWHSCFKKNKKEPFLFDFTGHETTTIIVEQPELHLHPAFQAKIADIFCKATSDESLDRANMIIETHSSHLINRLGELVSLGKLNSNDVQIILFEREPGSDNTTMRKTTFDEDGFLIDWPVGFMQPEV